MIFLIVLVILGTISAQFDEEGLFGEDDFINSGEAPDVKFQDYDPYVKEAEADIDNFEGMDAFGGAGGGMDGFDMSDIDMEEMQKYMQGFGGGQGFEPNTKQMKYLTCPVCKLLVEKSYLVMKELREQRSKHKYSEIEIDEALEDICDPFMVSGTWLGDFEIIEIDHPTNSEKATYDLQQIEEPYACMEDCHTIKEKCKSLYGEIGTDLVVELWRNSSPEKMQKKICHELMQSTRGSCGRKPLYFKKKIEEPAKQEL